MVTLYIIQGQKNGRRYVGITNDLSRRLMEHRTGHTYVSRVVGRFRLVHTEVFSNHSEAREREKFLKSGCGREWLDGYLKESGPASGG